ncbi:MAG: PKD domain-containing protein [Bacteroidales bacterium]|nr:PKD domain-containing protein [Bacteroidales bacterium]MDT8373876.1 PKD domain-containing protein [Bacteroidales bacterium]
MKIYKHFPRLTGILALLLMITACEPQLADKPDIGTAPTADQLDFSIAPGSDEFNFVITNTSAVTGIASWDFGNGTKGSGKSNIVRYSLPGDYTVKLTLVTRGGMATINKTLTQTETDYSIFTDPKFIFLSGGIDDIDGKTWALDSMAQGHLGVGAAGGAGLEWWSAAPLAKQAVKVLYDDRINFKIDGFAATYVNNGKSYVKDFRTSDPAYSNPVMNDTDYEVTFTPEPGTWFIEESGGKSYLTLTSTKPIFPIFDVGAVGGKYEILNIEENLLVMVAIGGDGNAWHYQLIPAGYVKPTISFTVNVTEGTDNEVSCSVTDYSIPAGQSVTGITWNFGDGSDEVTGGKDEVVNHVYMRKGTYTVTAKINSSLGMLNGTQQIVLANNNSAYVEFLLDMMIVYNDFSEVQVFPVLGQDCSVTTVDNPYKEYPNKSAKVAYYTKTDNQWANAYMQLNSGFRFDLRLQQVFKVMVYGKAGDQILLKLENTDKGGNAWQTGTYDLIYTIQKDNTWEVAEYDFNGVGAGWDWTGDIFTSNIVTDDNFNHDFYNVVRIMCNPGVGEGTHSFYFDELSGPHVEGIHK